MMKHEKTRQGTVSNINTSNSSFTLTTEDGTFTVTLATNARIVGKKFSAINFSDIKNGDTVRVFGKVSNTAIPASVVRDTSAGQ